jgi:hypothetical protein
MALSKGNAIGVGSLVSKTFEVKLEKKIGKLTPKINPML